jgi:RNA polymerase sigma-70 factor (ECF subfamily)
MLEPGTQARSLDPHNALTRRAVTPSSGAENLPDLLLIERARGGDEQAIEALVRRYGRRLFRVAHSVLGEEDRAESVVQDVYLLAFGDLSRYEPTGKFAAWLTRLVYQQSRSLRGGARSATTASEDLERRELEHVIEGLPEVFRTVFVLRVVEGISGIETAASLGVHETTVRTRLYRAHRRLEADTVRRIRATPGLLEFAPARLERLVSRVLAQLPHGSMLTISASSP